MTVYTFRVGPYTRQIYLDGNRTFEQCGAEYRQPIIQYAAKNLFYLQIDEALSKGLIDQATYDQTIAIKATIEPRTDTNSVPNPIITE